MNKSKVWITSDYHFNHTNVIQYCDRPFDSVEHMNKSLIEQWNALIAPDDTVYHLGDFCLTGKIDLIKNWIDSLNGNKKFVLGNHDAKGLKRFFEQHSAYENPGFYCHAQGTASLLPDLYRSNYNQHIYLMCHYPILAWGHEHFHLFGHQHGNGKIYSTFSLDIGWDVHKRPMTIEELTNLIIKRDGPLTDRHNRKIIINEI